MATARAKAKLASLEDCDRVQVLGYRIPWAQYITPGAPGEGASSDSNLFVSEEDASTISTCSAWSAPRMSEAIASGDAAALHFPRAMLRVVVNVRDVRVLQYLLTLLCDYLLADLERRSALLLAEGELVLTALLQLVGTSGSGACITSTDANSYVLEYAARAASLLLSIDASFGVSVSSFKAWVQQNLRLYGSSSPKQVKVTEVAVESLMILLRNDYLKTVFISLDDGLSCLTAILATQNSQLLYDVLHCLWLISLKREHHASLEQARVPLHILRALRPSLPMKAIRVGLGTLVNLMKNSQCAATMALAVESVPLETLLAGLAAAEAAAAPAAAAPGMAGGGGGSTASSSASSASSTDPELAEDARWARETIAAKGGRFGPAYSNVERYIQELQTGTFHWTTLHTPQFWKENARHFERDSCSLLKQLARLIINPDSEDVTIAVALFDAGEFASTHPQGRSLATSTGLKDAVLLHLETKRKSMDDVKQQALMAMSKIIRA